MSFCKTDKSIPDAPTGVCEAPRVPSVKNKRRGSLSGAFFGVFGIICLVLILFDPESAIQSVSDGLSLCMGTVIPSLFPFMVISEVLIACGAGETAGHIFSGPMRFLFGISGAASCSLFLGSVCGFPVGAGMAASMYDKGILTKREVEHLLTFSNNPSSAFLISAVGVSMLSDRSLGILLYAVSLFTAGIIGIFGRFILRPDTKPCKVSPHTYPCTPGGVHFFTHAVTTAAKSVLAVCAYVVFFSALIGTLSPYLKGLGLPSEIYALIYGSIEMSGGVAEAAAVTNRLTATVLCAFICGWSGLSVHMQIMSVCGGRGISFKPYFIAKLAQGILCAAIVCAVLVLFPDILRPAGEIKVMSLTILPLTLPPAFALPSDIIFIVSIFLSLISGKRKI